MTADRRFTVLSILLAAAARPDSPENFLAYAGFDRRDWAVLIKKAP